MNTYQSKQAIIEVALRLNNRMAMEALIRLNDAKCRYYTPLYWFQSNKTAIVHVPKTGGTTFHKHMVEHFPNTHCGLSYHRPISSFCGPSKYSYVTIMRDPIDRVWSYYQMCLRGGSMIMHKWFADRGLLYFLTNRREARNLAVKFYAGTMNESPDVNLAARNLQMMRILDFEQLSSDLEQYSGVPCTLNERNASYQKPTNKERHLIAKFNQADCKLYDHWKSG